VYFSAAEEEHRVGAKYLAEHCPYLFSDLEISLTFDGFIEETYSGHTGKTPLVMFVPKGSEDDFKYKKIVELTRDFAAQVGTTNIIYRGKGVLKWFTDNAAFPPEAFRAMHFQSPYRGQHSPEWVHAVDLVSYTDLLVHIIVSLDKDAHKGQPGASGDNEHLSAVPAKVLHLKEPYTPNKQVAAIDDASPQLRTVRARYCN